MPRLLDHMPFSSRPDEIVVRGDRVRIRADQVIVWVSLSMGRVIEQSPATIPFPAILDTGHTHSFALNERHLREWAGLRNDSLALAGAVRDRGQRIALRVANLWVHTNERGSRVRLTDRPPHRLNVSTGIAVYPGVDFPRLPILGLRAIAENALTLNIYGSRREATLCTPFRWWPFG
jgi:hypothetical protein